MSKEMEDTHLIESAEGDQPESSATVDRSLRSFGPAILKTLADEGRPMTLSELGDGIARYQEDPQPLKSLAEDVELLVESGALEEAADGKMVQLTKTAQEFLAELYSADEG